MYKNILTLSNFLQSDGLKKWDKVVIYLKNQIDFITILLACINLWAVVVILDPSMWKRVLSSKILITQPRYIFLEWRLYDIFYVDKYKHIWKYILKNIPENLYHWVERIISWRWSIFASDIKSLSFIYKNTWYSFQNSTNLKDDDEALIVFTGWTTLDPKGVIHTHKSLYFTIIETQNIIWKYSIFYADIFHFALLGIASWSKVILWDERYTPKKVQKLFKKYNIECSFFAPYKLQQFIDTNMVFADSLKTIFTWSAPVFHWFLTRLYEHLKSSVQVICLYGMTEVLPIAYIDGKEKLKLSFVGWDVLWKIIDSVEYRLGDDGELCISAPHASKKYLWEITYDFIITWDIVSLDWRYLLMKSRKKDMIIRWNYNIYPAIYESIIANIPWIIECAIFWIPENDTNEYIILLIDSNIDYTQNEILTYLNKWEFSIDNFAIPQFVFFWKIPKYGRQKKIHKNQLSILYADKVLWK